MTRPSPQPPGKPRAHDETRPRRFASRRGTVSLVALCFVAVLGISLAGYIAVCSRAMTLSNRSFQGSLAKQLAEAGIEEALRAFNKNDWSDWSSGGFSTDWTVDTTNRRATATLSFPADKLGQGTTATVRIRVDNYDAPHVGSVWNATKTYRINDLVGHNGVWYRSLENGNLNRNPSTQTDYGWWVPAPIKWAWCSNVSYAADHDIVNYQGDWWLCSNTHTSGSTFSWSNWTWIPAPSLAWKNSTWYNLGSFVYRTSNSTWYRCTSAHFSNWSFDSSKFTPASWEYQNSRVYSFGAIVNYNGTWHHYINSNPASGVMPGSNSAYWENALSGASHGWNSGGIIYNPGDTAYSGGQWYRCIRAHTSSGSITPADAAYWSNAPLLSPAWESGRHYNLNDTVSHLGVWYLSIQDSNIAQNPTTATSHWVPANTPNPSYTWNPTSNYSAGAYRCYGGVWYRSILTHTNQSPNNPTYWKAEGAAVVYAEANVSVTNSPALRIQLRAPVAPAPLFPNAAAATTSLTVTTGTGTVDSYDSSVGAYGGTNIGYSAVLAAGSALSINGTTAVKGYLAAPSLPSNISTGTTVKGAGSPASNIDPARLTRSTYVPQFDPLPASGLSAAFGNANFPKGNRLPDSSTVNLGSPGATTPSRYYHDGNLYLGDDNDVDTININGPVILYINGHLRTENGSPDGTLVINSAGSAEIHISGGIRTDSYSGGFNNRTLDPKKLIVISDSSSSTSQQLAATSNPLYGVVYVPKTATASGLDIRNDLTIYGAVSARKVTFSSSANVHFDASLRHVPIPGVDQPYAVTEWRELPVAEQATMP